MRLLLSLSIVIFFATVASADLYFWQDKDGNAHIADKIEKVPEEYRDKVRVQKSSEPSVAANPAPSKETPSGKTRKKTKDCKKNYRVDSRRQ